MSKLIFTTRAVAELELRDGKDDAWIWDLEQPGFGVRLRAGASGASKTWYVQYYLGGRKTRLPLGDVREMALADARVRAHAARSKANDHVDPRAERDERRAGLVAALEAPTFRDYAADYLLAKKLRASTMRERQRYLADGPHFEPFRRLRLSAITKKMVAAQVKDLAASRSPQVAKAARAALFDMFKAAVADGHIAVNPVEGTSQPTIVAPARKRVLSAAEVQDLWKASGDDDYGRITKLALLLAARREEIGGMRWSELEAGTWTLPAERSKTARELVLPLPPAALEIVRSIPCEEGRPYLFGSRSSSGFSSWSVAKRKLDERLSLEPWCFHDLRRTAITGMHDLGIDPHIVMAIANHAPVKSVHNEHYNRASYMTQKAEALRLWAEAIVPTSSATVTALRPAA